MDNQDTQGSPSEIPGTVTKALPTETTAENLPVTAKKDVPINYKTAATGITGFVLGVALAIFAYLAGPEQTVYPITYIICISGSLLGWLIAIISTPYDKTDENKIGKFTKLVGTFLTGYILSKFDKVIEKVIDPGQILSSLIGIRLLLFICSFVLTFIVVFVYRQYATGKVPR
jgi:VIT1/CCC1 family predicted Fe2+/Mn2+ transporter